MIPVGISSLLDHFLPLLSFRISIQFVRNTLLCLVPCLHVSCPALGAPLSSSSWATSWWGGHRCLAPRMGLVACTGLGVVEALSGGPAGPGWCERGTKEGWRAIVAPRDLSSHGGQVARQGTS